MKYEKLIFVKIIMRYSRKAAFEGNKSVEKLDFQVRTLTSSTFLSGGIMRNKIAFSAPPDHHIHPFILHLVFYSRHSRKVQRAEIP